MLIEKQNKQKIKISRNSVDEITTILARLETTLEMKERIELCENVLSLLNDPAIYAFFQVELGNSLCQNQRGNRSTNIEKAIDAYDQALEIITKDTMPFEWAKVMINYGNAYMDRIQGDHVENIEKAIDTYQNALEIITKNDMPYEWAAVMTNYGSAYLSRTIGERSENIEKAIKAYQQVISIFKKDEMPLNWAKITMNLGSAYLFRIRGEKSDNIEEAITLFHQALEITDKDLALLEWVQVMTNLGNAYKIRIQGERSENIENAIKTYLQILEMNIKNEIPLEWAKLMVNLGNAYFDRINGKKIENIEKAIQSYKQALEINTKSVMPFEWASVMMNLGTAYKNRISGIRSENIEEAIDSYQQALEVNKKYTMPYEWSEVMMNLGIAFFERIQGGRSDNIEKAINLYGQALTINTQDTMPFLWAKIMMNLGNAYFFRIRGERSENIEEAITAYNHTLKVNTKDAMPFEWAIAMINLGNAYSNRLKGEFGENIECAIKSYQQALEIRTKDKMPFEWSQAMLNLGNAYKLRVHGKRSDNFERAINSYIKALEVNTKDAMPFEWATIMMNLGNAYVSQNRNKDAKRFQKGIESYQQALTIFKLEHFPLQYFTVNQNFASLLFEDQQWEDALHKYINTINAGNYLLYTANDEFARKYEISKTSHLYFTTAYCMLKLKRFTDALHYLEQGKTRFLKQELVLSELNMKYLTQKQKQIINIKQKNIQTLENELNVPLNTPGRRNFKSLTKELRKSREDIMFQFGEISKKNSKFIPPDLEVSQILNIIPKDGALVTLLVTSQGSTIVIIPHGVTSVNKTDFISLDSFNQDDLNQLLSGREKFGGWLTAYKKFSTNSNKIRIDNSLSGEERYIALQDEQNKLKRTIEQINKKLWEIFMNPIYKKLNEYGFKEDAQILIMPQGGLGLLPLHSAWRKVNNKKRYFIDEFCVTYIPSAYLYKLSQKRVHETCENDNSLFSAINPSNDLNFSNEEGEMLSGLFDHVNTLYNNSATLDKVIESINQYKYIHFSCHGFYNWEQPMKSGLLMANNEKLTLLSIISEMNLKKSRLVVLSACETGITDIEQTPDEFIGLHTGFMQAGVPGVISTLWAINDISSMFLIERFYINHLQNNMEPATALRQAQLWLRNVTAKELLRKAVKTMYNDANQNVMTKDSTLRSYSFFSSLQPDEKPFAHPFHWAGFIFNGA